MPNSEYLPVKKLKLDLRNYRTVPQKDEHSSVRTIISIDPDKFYGIVESLLNEGYSPVENILVFRNGSKGEMIVREGNRRIGAMKLMLGLIDVEELEIPANLKTAITALDVSWKKENATVPCAVYGADEVDLVDRIVARVHGRLEKASRIPWTAVAKARHDRDESGKNVPELNLLERYLEKGANVNSMQKERWSGRYPITVLEELLRLHTVRLGFQTAKELAAKYPKIPLRGPLEDLMYAIGSGIIGFDQLRHSSEDILFTQYKIPPLPETPKTAGEPKDGAATEQPQTSKSGGQGQKSSTKTQKALPLDDPKSIVRVLQGFAPRGKEREKVATLLEEAVKLKIEQTPLAFCFLLRSMFEISAAAYCAQHKGPNGPVVLDKEGKPKKLGALLRAISKHFVDNSSEENDNKLVHGAGVELSNPTSVLSVTSMNNLVHSATFSTKAADISLVFHRIFPLLKVMNNA